MPRVFISYSQDSGAHRAKVRALADRLVGDGVDCVLDQYEPHPKEPWPRWMERQVEDADFVLVVCTETHFRRAAAARRQAVTRVRNPRRLDAGARGSPVHIVLSSSL